MVSIACSQDCSLVREAQGGSQAAFEAIGTYLRPSRVTAGVAAHRFAKRCSRHPSRGIHKDLQEAGWLPVRVLLFYLDLPHCHQCLPGPLAEESEPVEKITR